MDQDHKTANSQIKSKRKHHTEIVSPPDTIISGKEKLSNEIEWRCKLCGKKLGSYKAYRLHLRFSKLGEYFAGLPATCVCGSCQTLNELIYSEQDKSQAEVFFQKN